MTTGTTEKAIARAADVESVRQPEEVSISTVSRREFLYYIWGASMVMLLGAAGGIALWFALPRFRQGEFGGDFVLLGSQIPAVGSPPQDNPQGRFWLSNTEDGLLALYKVCTHLGCLFKWVEVNNRFECPCHGSKFQANGLLIQNPATRGLDRFEITVRLNDNTELVTDDAGNPIRGIDPAQVAEVIVHTGRRIRGPDAGVDAYPI
jgi:cytochrome b6-f complex iron-sulfur subunit